MQSPTMGLSGSPRLQSIKNINGERWMEFRKNLKPNFRHVWFNMGFPWLMIGAGFFGFHAVTNQPAWLSWLAIPLGAGWFTFWLQCFTGHFHEAAHYNIAPHQEINDLLANVLLAPFIGLNVKSYRKSHWEHHLHLGTTKDTETSYYHPLKFRRIFFMATGAYIFQSVFKYFKNYRKLDKTRSDRQPMTVSFLSALIYTIAFQTGVTIILFLYVSAHASAAWAVTMILLLPNLQNIRQTLEHRSLHADDGTDYSLVDHGPVNRLFGNDPFSKSLGSAGFNRHLLHHWDPGLSYTCFDQMENFLQDSNYRETIIKSHTTYWRTFKAMFRWR